MSAAGRSDVRDRIAEALCAQQWGEGEWDGLPDVSLTVGNSDRYFWRHAADAVAPIVHEREQRAVALTVAACAMDGSPGWDETAESVPRTVFRSLLDAGLIELVDDEARVTEQGRAELMRLVAEGGQ